MAGIRILVVLAVALAPVEPALAASAVQDDSKVEHCVVFVVDQADDGELLTTAPECFDTVKDAVAYTASGASPAARSAGSGVTVLSFTIGTHYDGLSGTGPSISVVGSNCNGGYWNTPPTWDNRISSTRNGCNRVKHHDYAGASGSYASTWGVGSLSNVPSYMNNRAESVSYWTS